MRERERIQRVRERKRMRKKEERERERNEWEERVVFSINRIGRKRNMLGVLDTNWKGSESEEENRNREKNSK